jgi:hypothetical protein
MGWLCPLFFDCQVFVHYEFTSRSQTVWMNAFDNFMASARSCVKEITELVLGHSSTPMHLVLSIQRCLAKNKTPVFSQPPNNPDCQQTFTYSWHWKLVWQDVDFSHVMTIGTGGCTANPNFFKIFCECWEKLECIWSRLFCRRGLLLKRIMFNKVCLLSVIFYLISLRIVWTFSLLQMLLGRTWICKNVPFLQLLTYIFCIVKELICVMFF